MILAISPARSKQQLSLCGLLKGEIPLRCWGRGCNQSVQNPGWPTEKQSGQHYPVCLASSENSHEELEKLLEKRRSALMHKHTDNKFCPGGGRTDTRIWIEFACCSATVWPPSCSNSSFAFLNHVSTEVTTVGYSCYSYRSTSTRVSITQK